MPKFVCKRCNHDFWGWGVYYSHKRGARLICPDCGGHLGEKQEQLKIEKLFNGADEAA